MAMSKQGLVEVAEKINALLEEKSRIERDAIMFSVLIKRLRSYEPEEKTAAIMAYVELLMVEQNGESDG